MISRSGHNIYKLLLVIVMILLTSPAYAEGPVVVYAWGYGDILVNVFDAIKYMTGENGYVALFKVAGVIGVLAFIISGSFKGGLNLYGLFMRFMLAIILWSLISVNANYGVYADVQVYDVYTNRNERIVQNVPLGFVTPIAFFSKLENGLNKSLHSAFETTAAGIGASGSNYIPPSIGAGLIYSASQYRVTNPNIFMTLNEYIKNCVFPDVLTGYFDPYTLNNSATFWVDIKDTHPARISKVFDATTAGKNGELRTCPKVYEHLDTVLRTHVSSEGHKNLTRSMGLGAETVVGSILGQATSSILGISQSSSDFLLNATALNHFEDAIQSAAAVGGVNAGALGFSSAKAQEVSRANMVMSGIQAKKYLPMAKGILICIIMCCLPLFYAFIVAMQMPGKLFGMMFGMFLAPCFWSFGDAILNFIIMIKASSYMVNWGGPTALTAVTKPIIETQALEMVNIVSSMYWIIPSMAMGFATMSAYALSAVTSSVTSSATAGVGSAAAEMGSGNVSFGNVSANNYRANT
ncbi:MAG: conjugal transfer protein TraG N-terminal domain-containing protein, partial [Deferribacteraceae bacterium]|nr:conjugal transfer protein TraG N-terminal domain-containing protein [Deferribacteraceae bacterium]